MSPNHLLQFSIERNATWKLFFSFKAHPLKKLPSAFGSSLPETLGIYDPKVRLQVFPMNL